MSRTSYTVHHLKSWPEYFEAQWDCSKQFELRHNDRGYEVGDELLIHEWTPGVCTFTRRVLHLSVNHVLHGGVFDLPGHICVMSTVVLDRWDVDDDGPFHPEEPRPETELPL